MTVSLPPILVWMDFLRCLGLGLLLSMGYSLCRLVLGSSPPVCFVLDLLAFALAAVLVTGYAVGPGAAGIVRWYHCAGMLAGVLAWQKTLAPVAEGLRQAAVRLLLWPERTLKIWLWAPMKKRLREGLEKKLKKTRKTRKKQLQKKGKLLYNSE